MPRLQTLAEYLGPQPVAAEPGVAVSERLSGAEFAERVVNSKEFWHYIVNGLILGELPAAIIVRLMDYAPRWGKPVERLEVKDTSPRDLSDLSDDELYARIQQLADRAAAGKPSVH